MGQPLLFVGNLSAMFQTGCRHNLNILFNCSQMETVAIILFLSVFLMRFFA